MLCLLCRQKMHYLCTLHSWPFEICMIYLDDVDCWLQLPTTIWLYLFIEDGIWWFAVVHDTKGHLNSKCLFAVFSFSQKQVNLRYHSSKVEFFRSFFESIEDTKSPFDINWPLGSFYAMLGFIAIIHSVYQLCF